SASPGSATASWNVLVMNFWRLSGNTNTLNWSIRVSRCIHVQPPHKIPLRVLIMDQTFPHLLLLLGLAVTVVLDFQRLRIPSSLGYLLVGVILRGSTLGPSLDPRPIQAFAEFGIVFLLFTIGLRSEEHTS